MSSDIGTWTTSGTSCSETWRVTARSIATGITITLITAVQHREHDQCRVASVDADQQRVAGREHRQHRVHPHLLVHLLDREQREAAEQRRDRDQRRGGVGEVVVRGGVHRTHPFAR